VNIDEYDINTVMKYFYEISNIPRMSGKEEKIADYIECFAKKRNLNYVRDSYHNIIITKEASKWNESDESIMLQCHLDMVCEKEEFSTHDFLFQGLEVYIDGDDLKAKDTTLGADNGIGVAIILAILDSHKISHPKIEAIFTVQEETTMEGAKQIDVSSLQSTKMICLDNMNEEELWIGCAGAKIFEYEIHEKQLCHCSDETLVKIGINGFRGGHSGKDIAKGRGNPIKEMGNLLNILYQKYDIHLKNIYGGRKVNVIPRECYSEIYVKYTDLSKINSELIHFHKSLKKSILYDNENISVTLQNITCSNDDCFDSATTKKVIDLLTCLKNGVYHQDKYGNPLVSLNIGKIENDSNSIKLSFSIRSNRTKVEKKLENELQNLVYEYHLQETVSELAGYEHKERSRFIDTCKTIYKQYFKRNPKVVDMHICLEAGFFGSKIPDLDFIAIAPNIYDAHSPKERCSLSSIKRVYHYILLILDTF